MAYQFAALSANEGFGSQDPLRQVIPIVLPTRWSACSVNFAFLDYAPPSSNSNRPTATDHYQKEVALSKKTF